MKLYNKINSEELKDHLYLNDHKRITLSFYKYFKLNNPELFRDHIYIIWDKIGVLGRIYVASEGINAQLSIPDDQFHAFKKTIDDITFLKGVRLNEAVDDGKSFFKLKVKVRPKILADGLNDDTFDVTNIGVHLNAKDFNALTDQEDTVIIDMRNHYESEIGHFNAILPDADTFREALHLANQELVNHKDKNIIMYCTGGIRCEKASAYFKHKGFENIYQLEGGIIKYGRDVIEQGLENKYRGKNFVFDERLSEEISDEIIAHCHQCGNKCDTHTNCKNVACNLLFIQCAECAVKYANCCSENCKEINSLPAQEQKFLRKGADKKMRIFSKGRFYF